MGGRVAGCLFGRVLEAQKELKATLCIFPQRTTVGFYVEKGGEKRKKERGRLSLKRTSTDLFCFLHSILHTTGDYRMLNTLFWFPPLV